MEGEQLQHIKEANREVNDVQLDLGMQREQAEQEVTEAIEALRAAEVEQQEINNEKEEAEHVQGEAETLKQGGRA